MSTSVRRCESVRQKYDAPAAKNTGCWEWIKSCCGCGRSEEDTSTIEGNFYIYRKIQDLTPQIKKKEARLGALREEIEADNDELKELNGLLWKPASTQAANQVFQKYVKRDMDADKERRATDAATKTGLLGLRQKQPSRPRQDSSDPDFEEDSDSTVDVSHLADDRSKWAAIIKQVENDILDALYPIKGQAMDLRFRKDLSACIIPILKRHNIENQAQANLIYENLSPELRGALGLTSPAHRKLA